MDKLKSLILILMLLVILVGCKTLPDDAGSVVSERFHKIQSGIKTVIVEGEVVRPSDTPSSSPAPTGTTTYTNTPEPPTPTFTLTPSQTPTPTTTPTPLMNPSTSEGITLSPSDTPIPLSSIPRAYIQFLHLGEYSQVVSPVYVHARIPVGANGVVRIELIGEDGRIITRHVKEFAKNQGAIVELYDEVSFEIDSAAETARLVLSIDDDAGRIMALASLEIILLPSGAQDFNPIDDQLERIVIKQPVAKTLIQGGKLLVAGVAKTRSEKPLYVELLNQEGRVIGSRMAEHAYDETDSYKYFSIELKYDVYAPTWARLVVKEVGGRIPGIVHLSSVEILLSP